MNGKLHQGEKKGTRRVKGEEESVRRKERTGGLGKRGSRC